MNCRAVRKLIAPYTGELLTEAKKLRLEIHLQDCPSCRAYAEGYRAGLAALKQPDGAMILDFTEDEWNAAIRKSVAGGAEKERPRPALSKPALRPVFSYSLAVLLVGAAVLMGVRRFPWLVPSVENRPASEGAIAKAEGTEIVKPIDPVIDPARLYAQVNNRASSEQAAGDVPTLTWISQETGLQIVWFVNDNIKLED